MATAARRRRIVIRRKKTAAVVLLGAVPQQTGPRSLQMLDAAKYRHHVDPIYCMWCFAEKENTAAKCACCGRLGSTNKTQREISQVFITSGEL